MTSISNLKEQIQTLQKQIVTTNDPVEMDLEIDRIARSVIQTPMPPEARGKMLNELLRLRTQIVQHAPVQGMKGNSFSLNLIQDVTPSPLCPAYNTLSFPTVTTYDHIGWNISCMRLDPKAMSFVPPLVLEQAGPLQDKQVDLLWTAIDGRFYQFNRSLNHATHAWTHRHALPGPEKIPGPNHSEIENGDSNVHFDVDVGLFPEIGYEKANDAGAIAINRISPMHVHTHAPARLNNVKPEDMLYSPDNSHFRAIAGTPFGIDWSVMKKDDRVAITKRLVIFDYDHPICKALLSSIRDCSDLNEHLQGLKGVPHTIQQTFSPVIEAFETGQPGAMALFHRLPLAFQYGIFRETWLSFNSPNVHGDFGRASFENQESLARNFHCSNAKRGEILRSFCGRLEHLLVESQFQLLLQSQSLVKGDNVLKMMRCAELFKKDPEIALASFTMEFTEQEKEAVRFAFWELSGCPRKPNFGSTQFPLNCDNPQALQLKIQSILLAASRQAHQFTAPIVEAPLEGNAQEAAELVFEQLPVPPKKKREFELPASLAAPIEKQEDAASQAILQEVLEFIFSEGFASSNNKKERINAILSRLDKNNRDEIYGRIFHYSRDPHKGGPKWAEEHVVDNIEILINSLQDQLN
jgi:hypothetical protein